ncbi:MAG: hypothetical protein U1E42_16080 [Rhodospirillales bacterium]
MSASWSDPGRSDDRDRPARFALDATADGTQGKDASSRPITAADLPLLADRLTADRIAPLLRRQRALLIRSATDIRPIYTEISAGIDALERAIAPDIRLRADPRLWRCLGAPLDRAILAAFTSSSGRPPEPFSLALGLATLASPEFAAFLARLSLNSGDPRVLIRLRLEDVLADVDAYVAERDRLHDRGLGVVLEGLSPATLEILDPAGFDADFVKVRFPPSPRDRNVEDGQVARLATAVSRIGGERLIFADIDSETTVMQAFGLGVRRFQGRFIDELVAAMLAKGWL